MVHDARSSHVIVAQRRHERHADCYRLPSLIERACIEARQRCSMPRLSAVDIAAIQRALPCRDGDTQDSSEGGERTAGKQ